MPYINNNTGRRQSLIKHLDPVNTAELNFIVFYTVLVYLKHAGMSYDNCENVMEAYENSIGDIGFTESFGYLHEMQDKTVNAHQLQEHIGFYPIR